MLYRVVGATGVDTSAKLSSAVELLHLALDAYIVQPRLHPEHISFITFLATTTYIPEAFTMAFSIARAATVASTFMGQTSELAKLVGNSQARITMKPKTSVKSTDSIW